MQTIEQINSRFEAIRANLNLAPRKPIRRRCSEMLHLADFDIDCGSLAVEAGFAFDVTREDADPSTGYDQATWAVEGEIIAIKVSGLTIRRNLADPYICDLLDFISEDTRAAQAELGRYEQFLCDQIQTEYENGDRVLGGAMAAE